MTKRRRSRRSQSRRSQRPAALRQQGVRDFKRGNYNQAIRTWEQVAEKAPDVLNKAELAEAYFRRGLELLRNQSTAKPTPEAILADLQRAVELQPENGLYAYHLGLMHQRQGNVEAALPAYRRACDLDKTLIKRAAYPLALALLQQGQDPTQDALWAHLAPDQQTRLKAVSVFRRRPYQVDAEAPLLWQGLAALDSGECEAAHTHFTRLLETTDSPTETAAAHYYLGVIAAQNEDWHNARREWSKAALKGKHSAALTANLGELYHRLAEERLLANDVEGAEQAADEALRHTPDDKRLKTLLSQVYQRIGYQHALNNELEDAYLRWDLAYELENGSFRLAYNMALAYEKSEQYWDAANLWREALRRRPRKDNHPDAISNEQVAKLWKRAAEAYLKAEEFEEAINVYKLAVKWNPDHLETRIALVEGYINDGRLTAATNELERILEKDPDYIPALLRMGEIYLQHEYWWYASAAERYFNRVLELEPDNATARQGLSDYYMSQGDNHWHWRGVEQALPYYEKALDIQPNNSLVLIAVGGCYMELRQTKKGEACFASALDYGKGNLQVYLALLEMWLSVENTDKAQEIMTQIEADFPDVPAQVYMLPAIQCIQNGQYALARPWLEKMIEKTPPDDMPLLMVGQMLAMSPAYELAAEYLHKAIAEEQGAGWAYCSLAMIALRQGNQTEADQHLAQARKIATKTRDMDLQQQVMATQGLMGLPPMMLNMALNNPQFMQSILTGDPSGLFGPGFMDDDNYYDDEEYDDDEDSFFNIFGL